MAMDNWKRRIMLKESRKGRGQTTGITKKGTCVADVNQRFMAKNAKSYKDPGYGEWCTRMDKINGMKR